MNNTNQPNKSYRQRTNAEWPAALRGTLGEAAQAAAFAELTSYLHKVAFNYLSRCTEVSETLEARTSGELATIAEDHVYDIVERLVQDDFALLDQYSERGRFLGWCAQVLRNSMVTKMRKSSWRKQVPMTVSVQELTPAPQHTQPEQAAIQESILAMVQSGIDALPERHRIALTRCLIDGDSAQSVADDFGTTQNAINVLVYRAKRKLRTYLIGKGMDHTIVSNFA